MEFICARNLLLSQAKKEKEVILTFLNTTDIFIPEQRDWHILKLAVGNYMECLEASDILASCRANSKKEE